MMLTDKACAILVGEEEEYPRLTMQLLSVEPTSVDGEVLYPIRYRAVLSDGKYAFPVMLSMYLEPQVKANMFSQNCIVRVHQITREIVGDIIVVIVLQLEIQQRYGAVIGSPKELKPTRDGVEEMFATDESFKATVLDEGDYPLMKVNQLTPLKDRWTVIVRVHRNTGIMVTATKKTVINFTLLDETGTISAVAFGAGPAGRCAWLEAGKVYRISRGTVTAANQYYRDGSQYQIKFGMETVFAEVEDDGTIPNPTREFVTIDQLPLKLNTIQNVIGVIISVGSSFQVTKNKARRVLSGPSTFTPVSQMDEVQVKKALLELQIVDQTKCGCRVAFWDKVATDFDQSVGSVIVLRNIKICDFGGISLNTQPDTSISYDEDIPEVNVLRAWFEEHGRDTTFQMLSGAHFRASSATQLTNTVLKAGPMTLSDAAQLMPADASGHLFETVVTLKDLDKESLAYNGCPEAGCNGGVSRNQTDPNAAQCSTCRKVFTDFQHRYCLKVLLTDGTKELWCTIFDPVAERMVGVSVKVLEGFRFVGSTRFEGALKALKRKWKMTLCAKLGRAGKMYTVVKAEPVPETATPSEED